MQKHTNIFLIGFRCTGKSTVGKALAQSLGRSFVDADKVLEQQAGMTIAQIVEKEGWQGFRSREKSLVEELCKGRGKVVAPGGGAVLDADNSALMRENGFVAWLNASAPTIAARMEADAATAGQRPSLTGKGVLEEVCQVLEQRGPIYEKTAHFKVETDGLSIEDVANTVENAFQKSLEGL
ncbi:MAG: shikimate kinase AroL, partial [Desulfatibacillaceae bacterium]|nr:shikimate kinase AroL [Desulfatibacillaceae bacterium]